MQIAKPVASELLDVLGKLRADRHHRRWSSLYIALKNSCGKDRIDRLVKRIRLLQDEIQFRVVLNFQESLDAESIRTSSQFKDLDARLQESIRVILVGNQTLFDKLDNQTAVLRRRQEEFDEEHQRCKNSIVSAITELALPKSTGTYRLSSVPLAFPLDLVAAVHEKILGYLSFRSMSDREEDVADPYEKTFNWAFDDVAHKTNEWTKLADWLRHGNGCFWINGKAGSGKSTFMKHISKRKETREALQVWAGSNKLSLIPFFFWRSGVPLQRSQVGLLRSLLHAVLTQHKAIIPKVLPGIFNEVAEYQCRSDNGEQLPSHPHPPTEVELKLAFVRMMQELPDDTRLCIFIDGIDEYEGDSEEILGLLKSVAFPSVKFVLSSRPTQACRVSFGSCASLRLQDLTEHDIRHCVTGQLNGHGRMLKLQEVDPRGVQSLVDEIVDRSSGVFLWVTLVLTSLLRGLNNFDRLSDLRQRLEGLPTRLEDLYKHMFNIMEPTYRKQAYNYLQIVLNSSQVQSEQPLTVLQMSFADNECAQGAIYSNVGPLSDEEVASRVEETEGRITSRCCGLLETQGQAKNPRVTFLHHTVVDFLSQEDVWKDIVGSASECFLDTNIALLSSCLSLIKAFPISHYPVPDWRKEMPSWAKETSTEGRQREIWRWHHHRKMAKYFLVYCQLAESSSRGSQARYLDELARVLTSYMVATRTEFKGSTWETCWSSYLGLVDREEDFRDAEAPMILSAWYHLTLDLESRLSSTDRWTVWNKNPTLLSELISYQRFEAAHMDKRIMDHVRTVSCLLKNGANANIRLAKTTPWLRLLLGLQKRFWLPVKHEWEIVQSYFRVILEFVRYQAEPKAMLPGEIYRRKAKRMVLAANKRSVLAVIEDLREHFASEFERLGISFDSIEALAVEVMELLKQRGATSQRWPDSQPRVASKGLFYFPTRSRSQFTEYGEETFWYEDDVLVI